MVSQTLQGQGALPHELVQITPQGRTPTSYMVRYSAAIDRVLNWTVTRPYPSFVSAAFESLLRIHKATYSETRKVFANHLIDDYPSDEIGSLAAGPIKIKNRVSDLIVGYGYPWWMAIHVALVFFETFEEAEQHVDELLSSDPPPPRPWNNWFSAHRAHHPEYPTPVDYDFSPLTACPISRGVGII